MRSTLIVLCGVICALLTPLLACADSCPCCGQHYGDPMPGDEARVHALRRQHEATCCAARRGTVGPSQERENPFMEYRRQQQEQRANEAISLNKAGNQCYSRGDYDCAIRLYNESLRLNPDDLVVKSNLDNAHAGKANAAGLEYYKQKDWRNAARSFQEAFGHMPLQVYKDNLAKARKYLDEETLRRQDEEKLAVARANASRAMSEVARMTDTKEPVDTGGLDFFAAPSTASPDMDFMDPGSGKGLKIAEPPARPKAIAPANDPYSVKTRAEIIFEAFEHGNRDWERSIGHLRNYLATRNPDNVKVQQALSYLEGLRMRARDFESAKVPAPFDPEPNKERLLGALVPPTEGLMDRIARLFGSEAKSQPVTETDTWRYKRNAAVLQAVSEGGGDLGKGIAYLERKIAADETDFTSRSALQFLEGYNGYGEFVREQARKEKVER